MACQLIKALILRQLKLKQGHTYYSSTLSSQIQLDFPMHKKKNKKQQIIQNIQLAWVSKVCLRLLGWPGNSKCHCHSLSTEIGQVPTTWVPLTKCPVTYLYDRFKLRSENVPFPGGLISRLEELQMLFTAVFLQICIPANPHFGKPALQ